MMNENWGAYPRLMAKRQAERIAFEQTLNTRYDNPAWPDLSERFTPTMAGLPEPEPERAVWRHPIALSACLAIYAGLLVIGIWWLSGL